MRNKREKQQRLHWHSIYYHQCEFMRAYTSKHCAHLSKCETETVIKKYIYSCVFGYIEYLPKHVEHAQTLFDLWM